MGLPGQSSGLGAEKMLAAHAEGEQKQASEEHTATDPIMSAMKQAVEAVSKLSVVAEKTKESDAGGAVGTMMPQMAAASVLKLDGWAKLRVAVRKHLKAERARATVTPGTEKEISNKKTKKGVQSVKKDKPKRQMGQSSKGAGHMLGKRNNADWVADLEDGTENRKKGRRGEGALVVWRVLTRLPAMGPLVNRRARMTALVKKNESVVLELLGDWPAPYSSRAPPPGQETPTEDPLPLGNPQHVKP